MLNITPSTSIDRKLLFLETVLNLTNKVSKIAPNSVLSGIAGGVSKISGKAEKDIYLAMSQLFPDNAFSEYLEKCAENFGVPARLGSMGSSTYVRISAEPGTQYLTSNTTLTSNTGINFSLEENVTVGAVGFIYAKVSSIQEGLDSNVDSLSISQIQSPPSGHISVVNEYKAEGGRDEEGDTEFRKRIKESFNLFSTNTLEKYKQLFMLINPKVLRVVYQGIDLNGKITLGILTQNGAALSQSELEEILSISKSYFGLNEYAPFGREYYGINLKNHEYFLFDVSFRCIPDLSYNIDETRKSIQVGISKYFDFRTFNPFYQKIEWDSLLEIVKNTPGVKYVPDQQFYPRADISIPFDKIPRLRSFLMLDVNGAVLSNSTNTLSPVYYPSEVNDSYYKTVLNLS